MRPRGHHPLTDLRSDEEIRQYLEEVEGVIQACVEAMPSHAQFIADNCAAMPRM